MVQIQNRSLIMEGKRRLWLYERYNLVSVELGVSASHPTIPNSLDGVVACHSEQAGLFLNVGGVEAALGGFSSLLLATQALEALL